MNNCLKFFLVLFCSYTFCQSVNAQESEGGTPISYSFSKDNIKKELLPLQREEKFIAQDEANGWSSRVAAPIASDYNFQNSGNWKTLKNGDRVWTLQLVSINAKALALQLKDFYLPPGARLFFYNENKSQTLGAYTHSNNNDKRIFFAGILTGDNVTIEYFEPKEVANEGSLTIFKILHVYKEDGLEAAGPVGGQGRDFGDSAANCHININCPEAAPMQTVKQAVVRIIMVLEEGMGYCSGALLNNARNDATPYVMSAFHCQSEFTPMYDFYRFDFNFESDGCDDPSEAPLFNSIIGATTIAGYADTDFHLFQLSNNVPLSYNPYFLGWNRDYDYEPVGTNLVHHPQGDIKKYSHEVSKVQVFNNIITWDNGLVTTPRSHFRVYLDEGAYEGGSSGSPFMDDAGIFIGQLHGGTPLCEQAETYCGRMAPSWGGGGSPDSRLKDWLDPDNTGVLNIDGFDPAGTQNQTEDLTGRVVVESGAGFESVTVNLHTGSSVENMVFSTSTTTDEDGFYTFEGIDAGGDYYLTVEFDDCHRNGVTINDAIIISNHIVGIAEITEPRQLLKADASGNGNVTTFDIIQARQLIVFLIEELPSVNPFYFIDDSFVYPANTSPFEYSGQRDPFIITVNFLNSGTVVPDFVALKVGDMNSSASGCP